MTLPTASSPGARLRLVNLSKAFGGTRAVDNVTLELGPGSFTALLGPSGCGKSTMLSLIAGLVDADSGGVELDGHRVDGVPAEHRPIGLVFQKPLLFPHLSVEANVAFGLRMRQVPRREARPLVRDMLAKVQLSALAGRRVGALSGGQEQRVAIARALVLSPRLLLLDEPFSQLDATLRVEMRALVRALTDEAKVTTLFVTHDQAEAVELAEDIALMLDGRITGQAAADVFYTRPPSLAAARFFGATNELPGHVDAGRFTCPGARGSVLADVPDGPAVLVARPETLQLSTEVLSGTPGPTVAEALRLCGIATTARFAGTHLSVDVRLDGEAALTVHVPVGTSVELGDDVTVTAPRSACTVFGTGR